MNRGLERGFIAGQSKGAFSGLKSGLHGMSMVKRNNMLNPAAITDPKIRPVFFINGDNVSLSGGTIVGTVNLITNESNDLFTPISNILTQNQGTTYRPPVVVGGLGGRSYIDMADIGQRYLATGQINSPALYAATAPTITGTGFTYIFVMRRKQGGTYTILDARDSTTLPTPNDLLLEINSSGTITFDYRGGVSGSTTFFIGTAGVNLLNDWSILTVKAQLRNDGGLIPSDSDGGTLAKRYAFPSGAKVGPLSPLDIFVNGVEIQKTLTTNSFTNADYFGDNTYRMLNRAITLGNKGTTYGTAGTQVAAFLMIPAYIDKALQTKIENYFRWYYNDPF